MFSKPLSPIIEIPDASLNEKLVAANDNDLPSALSRENLEAESVLASCDSIEPGTGPALLVVAGVLCLVLAFLFVAWR